MLGEQALSSVIYQYLAHYHTERNHQGLANQLIAPEPDLGSQTGQASRAPGWGAELLLSRRGVTWRSFSTLRERSGAVRGLQAVRRGGPPPHPAGPRHDLRRPDY